MRGAASCKYIPFSVGQRACPCVRLAEAELEAASRVLLRSLRWRRAGRLPVDLGEEYGLTLAPAVKQSLRFSRVAGKTAGGCGSGRRARAAAPTMKVGRGGESDGRPRRATRRQQFASVEEAGAVAGERLAEAGSDRRGGWRASKAKGNRRNRRYENRLLRGAVGEWTGGEPDDDADSS